MRLGAVDLDFDAERLAEEAHHLEALLVIGATTPDKDLDTVLLERALVLLERANDALEGGRDVGKVGDAAADDENLAVLVDVAAGDEREDRLGVLVGLALGRRARVLAVVGELVGKAGGGDGVTEKRETSKRQPLVET